MSFYKDLLVTFVLNVSTKLYRFGLKINFHELLIIIKMKGVFGGDLVGSCETILKQFWSYVHMNPNGILSSDLMSLLISDTIYIKN